MVIRSEFKIKTPISDRKCKLCNTLEDEFNFLLECPLYNDLRQIYIRKYYWSRPNIPKFVELLTSNNKKILSKLCMFLYKSFEKRMKSLD